MAQFHPGSHISLGPSTAVEITARCEKLKNRDVVSKSDPVCILSLLDSATNEYHELGRSETAKNDLSPVWRKRFLLEYRFEERQLLKFEIYDWDSKSEKLSKHDFLGSLEISLAALVAAESGIYEHKFKEGPSKDGGKIVIKTEEQSALKEVVRLQFSARHLDKKDKFGKSDPYFVLRRSDRTTRNFDPKEPPLLSSEVIKNNLNPSWRTTEVKLAALCDGDYERPIKIDIFDWDSKGDHDLIGSVITTANYLNASFTNRTAFPVINPKKAKKSKKYSGSGELIVNVFSVEKRPTFVDFIQTKTALHFSVAVDFTASNGDPKDPRSLHFRDPQTGENQYTTAIRSVGDIVQDYDADKLFPALGFGAQCPPNYDQASHEFFLNMRGDSPFCAGVPGILEAYFTSLQYVRLHGPTNFSPVINHVARIAGAHQDGRQYFVLLIITDGIITDMAATKAALVSASSLPMSVIIVGVGNERFDAMEELDADKGLLKASDGRVAERDIVQFVELRKFVRNGMWSKELLARQVLAEVPDQLVQWMAKRGIQPAQF